jgi:hypothetical protein
MGTGEKQLHREFPEYGGLFSFTRHKEKIELK